MIQTILASLLVMTAVISFFIFVVYNIEKLSFKRFRPLKSMIVNCSESVDIKVIFFEEIKQNNILKYKLKNLNKNLYDKNLIDYSLDYIDKVLFKELRDLLSLTTDYRSKYYISDIQKYHDKSKLKRKKLLDSVEKSKNTKRVVKSETSPDLENILHDLKVKSTLLDSVISKSLYLNALTLKDKYNLAAKDETKSKILSQLKDINSFLDRDIAIVSENKDKLIINDLAINDIYLKDLETSWNQE